MAGMAPGTGATEGATITAGTMPGDRLPAIQTMQPIRPPLWAASRVRVRMSTSESCNPMPWPLENSVAIAFPACDFEESVDVTKAKPGTLGTPTRRLMDELEMTGFGAGICSSLRARVLG